MTRLLPLAVSAAAATTTAATAVGAGAVVVSGFVGAWRVVEEVTFAGVLVYWRHRWWREIHRGAIRLTLLCRGAARAGDH